MAYEVYEDSDCVLPMLELAKPCEIRIEITDASVRLIIGPRDWAWNRETGVLSGAGTMLPDDPDDSDHSPA